MQFLQSHSQYHQHDRQVCRDIKALVSLHVDVASARAQFMTTPLELDPELETESTPQCVIPWLHDSYRLPGAAFCGKARLWHPLTRPSF